MASLSWQVSWIITVPLSSRSLWEQENEVEGYLYVWCWAEKKLSKKEKQVNEVFSKAD